MIMTVYETDLSVMLVQRSQLMRGGIARVFRHAVREVLRVTTGLSNMVVPRTEMKSKRWKIA